MRRTTAIAATLALHGAVIGVMIAIPRTQPLPPISQRRTIELIDVEIVRPARKPPAPTPAPAPSGGGGGAPAAPVRAPQPVPSIVRIANPAPPAIEATRAVISHIDPAGPRAGGDGGSGGGSGGGDGDGIGIGIGAGLGAATARGDGAVANLAIPAPRPASKARPARLVYPANNRKTEPEEQFVARIDIDHEGYVVGARLVQGFGGHRDEQAASLIWRFRYAPALDDDGRPIRSTLDQPFLVGR